tara:strand:+ start:55 stop:246 length:192 start_codon:yes stop_codon:yes gene_type:complete
MRFPRYTQNLYKVGKFVVSYDTPVAKIEGDTLQQLEYGSVTTQRHINYVADYLGLKLRKPIND